MSCSWVKLLYFFHVFHKRHEFENKNTLEQQQNKNYCHVTCANMTGHLKLKPLVKKKNTFFKCIQSLIVDYDFNKNLAWPSKWQLGSIVGQTYGCRQKLKVVELFYSPCNTTSKLKPMDQSVIKNFKVQYCKKLMR